MSLRISIDTDRCTGNGRCYVVAPELFTDDERGYGEVIGDGTVPAELAEAARRVVGSCPEDAIVLTED